MIIRIKRRTFELMCYFLVIVTYVFLFTISTSLISPSVTAANTTNQTVLARVNVSNSPPDLYRVFITNPAPVELNAGTTTTVICNGSVADGEGYDTIQNVTATLFHHTSDATDADAGMNHYTNLTCGACASVPGTGGVNGTCSCQFEVEYYAQNGTWQCNMSLSDSFFNDTEVSPDTDFAEVLGIDVESLVLDYGNVTASTTSDPIRQNVTNIGNVPLNFTIRGYGSDNETVGQNFTMICETGANITFPAQRVSTTNSTVFEDMVNLTNQTRQFPDLTIPRRVEDNRLGNSSNSTFWKLQVPLGPSGVCNGTIIFGGLQDFQYY